MSAIADFIALSLDKAVAVFFAITCWELWRNAR